MAEWYYRARFTKKMENSYETKTGELIPEDDAENMFTREELSTCFILVGVSPANLMSWGGKLF